MSSVRVLVVDDSPVARARIVEILHASSGIEVVGQARDGLEAIELVVQLRPDIVTMDIVMPGMDGLEATRRIMEVCPTPIIVVTGSALDQVRLAMDALEAGALEVLPKPDFAGRPGEVQASRYLTATVRALARATDIRTPPALGHAPAPGAEERVVVITGSTGGPTALATVLAELPPTFPAPVIVLQRMSAGLVGGLADWLRSRVALPVEIAREGSALRASTVYIVPTGPDLVVTPERTLHLTGAGGEDPPRASTTLASVAQVYGAGAISVVLSGFLSEGTEGYVAFRRSGGTILVQNEETSTFYELPGAVVAAGVADQVLPVSRVGPALVELCARAG